MECVSKRKASYAFLNPARRARLGLDLDSEARLKKLPPRPVAFAGEPLRPDGFRFPLQLQETVFSFLSKAYDGQYEQELCVWLSKEDEESFKDVWFTRYPEKAQHWKNASTTGELAPQGLLDMLWRLGVKPGARFYDLGCGTGKLVTLAWMAGLRSTGIELSRARWEAYCSAVAKLGELDAQQECPEHPALPERLSMDCVCGDMLELDFTDADVIFINSVMLPPCVMAEVAKIARWMKPGSLTICYDRLEGPEFGEVAVLPQATSWNRSTDWQVQEVLKNPLDASGRLLGLKRADEFDAGSRCMFPDAGSISIVNDST